ncbi:MAG: adenylyltransferase/cytidyltransferase family protein [Candidatus Woesearchaeota archaeon]
MTKALIFGTFDKLHKGHVYFIRKADKITDEIICEIAKKNSKNNEDDSTEKDEAELYIVVARDENVEKIKGKKPIDNEMTRLMNVYMLGLARKVMLGDYEDFFFALKEVKPDIICLGYDQDDRGLEKYIKENKLKIKIIRIDAFEPDKYKSSKL